MILVIVMSDHLSTGPIVKQLWLVLQTTEDKSHAFHRFSARCRRVFCGVDQRNHGTRFADLMGWRGVTWHHAAPLHSNMLEHP
jgi:hypothetical protein